MKNDILLVGTGALATLFAARLSEAGHSVSMLGTWKNGFTSLAAERRAHCGCRWK
jgi:ketopantoate reductase